MPAKALISSDRNKKSGFLLGKISGIKIYLDLSWLILFFLFTFNFGVSVFPVLHPEWPFFISFSLGFLAALSFSLSILAHELAHAIVAKNFGLTVDSITLFIFGGIANIKTEPPKPRIEFWMTIVGPLTSILLGLGFILVGSALTGHNNSYSLTQIQMSNNLAPIPTLLFWIGPLNIVIGLFNMLPGFPLDGGRILHSVLWKINGDLLRSTQIATFIGRLTAWVLILLGVFMAAGVTIPFFGTGIINGVWIVFIGIFLNVISRQQLLATQMKEYLKTVKVEKIMKKSGYSVPAQLSLSDFLSNYAGIGQSIYPVIQGTEIIGVISMKKVQKLPAEEWNLGRVIEIMQPIKRSEFAAPDESALTVLDKLREQGIKYLPVIKKGELLGLVGKPQIFKWLKVNTSLLAYR